MRSARAETKGVLSDNPDILIGELTKTSSWYATLQYILAEADYWYQSYKIIALPHREEGKTELDRESRLASETAERKHLRDAIDDYSGALKERISLGQSALGYYKELRANKIA